MTALLRAAGALAAAGAVGLGYAVVEATRLFVLRHATVPAGRPGAAPLRILHLSDLHLLPDQAAKGEFVHGCLRTAPDMVVVTGDLLGAPDAVAPAIDLLGPLAERRVALFTLGSNDFYAPTLKNPLRYFRPSVENVLGEPLDTAALVRGLEARGWVSVENRRCVLPTDVGPVAVAGLGDAHVGHDRPQQWSDDPEPGDAAVRLGVAHAPYLRVLDTMASAGMDLTLAGHTHGGQVRVPGVGALVDNCDLPLRRARGLSRGPDGMWLHVSAGLGTNRYTPIRFACRPEATVVDVVARPA